MATRDAFLAKVRAAQPAARSRPDVPLFAWPAGDLRERFTSALKAMSGTCVDAASPADVGDLLASRCGVGAVICSATPEVQGTRALHADTPPA
jgi:L-lactate dehydrogenase complex protein LldG